ncbi:MAG: enoyl-CoA hydratase/isomerase family protein [Chloroflexi bacterium]|nr:enoyl-CoA hydratase/isomerase family protein [Chloroflexota bacterium]
MHLQYLIFEKHDGIARILFNRPEQRNAFSAELRDEFISCLEEIREDPSISAVITTGVGDVAYCAGGDIRGLVRRVQGDKRLAKAPNIHELVRNFPKVTIAAVNGYCLGAGLCLVLSHDIAIASEEKAQFAAPEVLLNVPPAQPTAYLLKAIPQKWAFDMILTGDRWDARTALQRGIVSRVVPHAQLQETALELAKRLSRLDPVTLEYSKRAANAAMDQLTRVQALEICSILHKEHNLVNPRKGKGAQDFLARTKTPPFSKGE